MSNKLYKKLELKYSKLQGPVIIYPTGIDTITDGHYLSIIFNAEFRRELVARGYDITTMKFEIKPLLPNAKKFPSLTKEFENKKQ